MNITPRQHHVLSDLGITVWRRRDTPALASASLKNNAADQSVVEVKGEVLLVTNSRLDKEQELLLGAMLKSVNLTLEQVSVLSGEQFQQVSLNDMEHKPLLVLGQAMPTDNVPVPFFSCPDLDQMLQHPDLKASAWQALKQLKAAI